MKATEIHILETQSTNALLKTYLQEGNISDFSIVTTDHQTEGRGQMGSSWSSEKGKNIACSIYKEIQGIKITEQFVISMIVSIALIDALEELMVPKLKIKWPNDIYSSNHKIAGVLIETTLNGAEISSAIIGVGMNVNQKNFEGLPNASSLICILGKPVDRSYLTHLILKNFTKRYNHLDKGFDYFQKVYESKLYRKDKVSLFKGEQIGKVNGIIKGVNDKGQLRVDIDNKGELCFNLKEVQLLISS